MGAFGNYARQLKYSIDFNQERPIEVTVLFYPDGKYRPNYFRYISDTSERYTYKIDLVKYVRNFAHYDLFCCTYTNYGLRHEVILKYYHAHSIWTTPI
ncbi:MAG: hypothetical protein K0S04_967 [Herbinix sp.]|jgi:hypothetical protein|nr:hypothetical protein [Herbinix sp.]